MTVIYADDLPKKPFKIILSYDKDEQRFSAELVNMSPLSWLITTDSRVGYNELVIIDNLGNPVPNFDHNSVIGYTSFTPFVKQLDAGKSLYFGSGKFKKSTTDKIKYHGHRKESYSLDWNSYSFHKGVMPGKYSATVKWQNLST